jgi:hypothetical protein
MQNAGYELPRILLLSTWVNKEEGARNRGKEEGNGHHSNRTPLRITSVFRLGQQLVTARAAAEGLAGKNAIFCI